MQQQIIISKEVAKLVSGGYGKHSIIQPTELKNGTFCLPTSVLKDSDLKEFQQLIYPFLQQERIVEKVDAIEILPAKVG